MPSFQSLQLSSHTTALPSLLRPLSLLFTADLESKNHKCGDQHLHFLSPHVAFSLEIYNFFSEAGTPWVPSRTVWEFLLTVGRQPHQGLHGLDHEITMYQSAFTKMVVFPDVSRGKGSYERF